MAGGRIKNELHDPSDLLTSLEWNILLYKFNPIEEENTVYQVTWEKSKVGLWGIKFQAWSMWKSQT